MLRCTLSIQCLSEEGAGSAAGLCGGQTGAAVRLLQRSLFLRQLSQEATQRGLAMTKIHHCTHWWVKSTSKQHEKPSHRIQLGRVGLSLHQKAREKNYQWPQLWALGQYYVDLNTCTHQRVQPQQNPSSPPAGFNTQMHNLKLSGQF